MELNERIKQIEEDIEVLQKHYKLALSEKKSLESIDIFMCGVESERDRIKECLERWDLLKNFTFEQLDELFENEEYK